MAWLTIPQTVAAIRERAGLTREALARELSVTFPTVDAWERGRSMPQPTHIKRIHEYADALGIRRDLTVVVIDDDPVSCSVLSGMLTNLPIPVTTISAQNGIKGLLLCGMHRPQLVLLDILMPGIDGVDVARQLQMVPDLPQPEVVFITAATDSATLDRVRATRHRVLTKPVGHTELAELLTSVAEKVGASVR